jgi:spore coat polysaccharide biosynthesis protein SpsF
MNKINCDVFIPVRLNSSRLPKKHLQLLNGKPALQHIIERLDNCEEIRNVVVCCTTSSSDDELVNFLQKNKIKFFRGSEKDILQRFLDAAKKFETDIIIDVEGDKIYTDPQYVDQIAHKLKISNIEFIIGNESKIKFNPSNHFIHGIIPAGFTKNALEKICKLKNTQDTETGYCEFFIKSPFIKSEFFVIETNAYFHEIRLTLDYLEDLKLAEKIFELIGSKFTKNDLIKVFKNNPELILITKNITKEWELNYNKNKSNVNFN